MAAGASERGSRQLPWAEVRLLEWMWREDGLGLTGSDLMIFAATWQACTSESRFVVTNRALVVLLGYCRETVSRSLTRLMRAGYVTRADEDCLCESGWAHGRYEVVRAAVDAACCTLVPRVPVRYLGPAAGPGKGGGQELPSERDEICDLSSPVPAVQGGRRELPSHASQDRVTPRHEEGAATTSPTAGEGAETSFQQGSLIIKNYHNHPDSSDDEREAREGGAAVDAGWETPGLDEEETRLFGELVSLSLLPVTAPYLSANLAAFRRLLREDGVPAEVVVEAYRDYARFFETRKRTTGRGHAMHLLTWLKMRPNKNVDYLMNARDPTWRARHPRAVAKAVPAKVASAEPHTHEHPRLTRLVGGGRCQWAVVDERGSRLIEGTLDVEDLDEVRRLYELMYEAERAGT